MSTPGPHDSTSSDQSRADISAAGQPDHPVESVSGEGAAAQKRRNWWIWISALLGVVALGLLIWALMSRSDLDSTQEELASTQQELAGTKQELDTTKQELDSTTQKLDSTTTELNSTTADFEELQSSQSDEGKGSGRAVLTAGAVATAKALYDDLAEQLGATQEDLAATEKDLEDANKNAAQAEQDAAAAKEKAAQADDENEKAKAEAEQAKAEAEAAQSKAAVAADCARAYVSAFGTLFEGDSVRAQAPKVRSQFASISADCKTALSAK
jgi:hypothetical protein